MRKYSSNRVEHPVVAVVEGREERNGAGFRHAVRDEHPRHVHPLAKSCHEGRCNWGPRRQAGPNRRDGVAGLFKRVELRDVHRGHAEDCCRLLLDNGLNRTYGVEAVGRKHDRTSVVEGSQESHHEPKAVEQRWRRANHVIFGQFHCIADISGVVDQVAIKEQLALYLLSGKIKLQASLNGLGFLSELLLVCQDSCFRISRRPYIIGVSQ